MKNREDRVTGFVKEAIETVDDKEQKESQVIKISKKYKDLYETNNTEMPTDIQVMINNNDIGSALLRIIEVIGQDDLELLDEDTLYFIISALNQLDIDYIRNKILLKVLPFVLALGVSRYLIAFF